MASYLDLPLIVIWKVSKRKNAKNKMKVIKHMNIDKFLHSGTRVPGIPQTAEIIQIGCGNVFIEKYKKQYKIK